MSKDNIIKLTGLAGGANGRAAAGPYAVTWQGKPPKLTLPDTPAHDDPVALCAWLSSVLRFDPHHPVTGAVHQGLRGPEGHVAIRRAGAQEIRFEPVAALFSPRRLFPMLASQLLSTDGEPYGFREEHARRIAHVTYLLCGATDSLTAEQETGGIVGTFLASAVSREGHTTYGATADRYAAAVALRRDIDDTTGRPIGPPRFLVDANTGELVIRVSDLQVAGRVHVGSTLPRGWLDARMEDIGWKRCRLDGHALPGRDGRRGAHLRVDVYRGFLPTSEDGPVTT